MVIFLILNLAFSKKGVRMEQLNFGDFVESAQEFKPIKSTDWKWSFKDYPESNGLKVFSCFACGGGSTMGYKLAGCEVLGCVEIDKRMNEIYVANHHPKYNFLMDIRDFNKIPNEELPEELFHLDILDGSPPCTTFSMAGEREDSWGKKKKFNEGQAEQTLDDLAFVFIDTVAKLKPKVVIMENVEGLLLGEAWSYVQRIYKEFNQAGYQVHHWLLKAEKMGVPQRRHRVFFIATRSDIDIYLPDLDMQFNYEPITFGEVTSGTEIKAKGKMSDAIKQIKKGEKVCDCMERVYGKYTGFTHKVLWEDEVPSTIIAGHADTWLPNGNRVSDEDVSRIQTFPSDYDYKGTTVPYVCGMSVPPVMMKRIAERVIDQIFLDNNLA